jgi:signal transduction histidine kinase
MQTIKKQSSISTIIFFILLLAIAIANYLSCKAYQQKGLFSVVSATSIIFLLIGTIILGISCFASFQLSAYTIGKLFTAYTLLLGLSISFAPCNQLREPIISVFRTICTLVSSLLLFQIIGCLTLTVKSVLFKMFRITLALTVIGSILIQMIALFPSKNLWIYAVSTNELLNGIFLSALFSAFLMLANYKKSNAFARKQIKALLIGLGIGLIIYLVAAAIPSFYLVQPQPSSQVNGTMIELRLEPTETDVFSVPLLLLSVVSIAIILVLLKREFVLKNARVRLGYYLILPTYIVIPLALLFSYTNCPLWLLICVASFLLLPAVIAIYKQIAGTSDSLEEQIYQERLTIAVEQEKQELSSYLHDEVLQSLIAFYRKIQADDTGRYKSISKDLASLISEVRGISHNLYPTMVEDLGLEQSLHIFLNELQTSYPETKIAFQYDFQSGILPKQFSLGVYRIVKELATNAAKHSGAQDINCDLSEDKHGYYLRLKDNGKGFSLPDSGELLNTPHMGLYTTQKRVHELHGQISFQSLPQMGTDYHIFFPKEAPNGEP